MQLLNQIRNLDFPATLPQTLLEVRQHFEPVQLEDVVAATRQVLLQGGISTRIRPGQSVAIGVGNCQNQRRLSTRT